MKSATKIILSNYTSKRFYSFARSLRSEYIWAFFATIIMFSIVQGSLSLGAIAVALIIFFVCLGMGGALMSTIMIFFMTTRSYKDIPNGDFYGYLLVGHPSGNSHVLPILISLLMTPVLFNIMMITFRRIHDLGLSILFLFVSPALYIMAENVYRFIEDPDHQIKNTLRIIAGAVSLILWLMMMFKRGTIGDNKFGEDPLGG